jgi:hypothetical protein
MVLVVHGSGQILNSTCKEIMEFSRQLMDVLGNQGWNTRAIKDVVNQMFDMIEEYHESFEGIWFSGFVWVGQEGSLEMITTRAVCAVSKGAGRDSNCLTNLLTFYSCCCSLQVSMEALICMVDHTNKRYKADCLGWGNVISSAHSLLTCRDLDRFAALCNDGYDAVQGEYYLYEHWQSSFVGHPAYIWIRNGVEGHEEDKESDDKSWGGSNESKGGCKYFLTYHQWIAYFEWLQFHPEEAARYSQFKVCAYAAFLHLLVLIIG